jgi:hypothetical protein
LTELKRERVARPGRLMRRVCTVTLVHYSCEQAVRERVARPRGEDAASVYGYATSNRWPGLASIPSMDPLRSSAAYMSLHDWVKIDRISASARWDGRLNVKRCRFNVIRRSMPGSSAPSTDYTRTNKKNKVRVGWLPVAHIHAGLAVADTAAQQRLTLVHF